MDKRYVFYFNIFDFFANHLASLEPTIRSSGEDVLPNVYCGVLTLILIPMYLYSEKINSLEKIASVALLGFLYIGFNINYINFLWHYTLRQRQILLLPDILRKFS